MKKDTTERIRKAQDKALKSLDYILETIPAPNFVEVVGRVGGDTVTYRGDHGQFLGDAGQ